MKNKFTRYIKLLYFIVLGKLLLLTSAVYEKGETDFSRLLVPDFSQVPEMLEALLASVTIITVFAFCCYWLESREKG